MTDLPTDNLMMFTQVREEGVMDLFLEKRPMPVPQDHEVLIRIEAAPINPSDLALMVGPADPASFRQGERGGLPMVSADVSPAGMRAVAARVGQALPIGNEGCGVVVAAGSAPAAQALLGKTVAAVGGEMYAEYRCVAAQNCLPLPDGTDPRDGASCFVNPLTSLAFVETMRREGHKAIVHTAAASNLGQMLVRICAADGVPLVNIVRSAEQVALLKGLGAQYVVDSSSETYLADLTAAIAATGATIAFDAIGGGKQAGQILACMENVAAQSMPAYSRYGSDTFKQVYIYGALDHGPTSFMRNFGFSFSISGFLLFPFMMKTPQEVLNAMRQRVIDELTTTFKSHYSHEVSLADVLTVDVLSACNAKRTGEKYLIRN